MKKGYMIAVLAGILAMPVAAWAEPITGTITSIDSVSGKVTLLRSGTNESVSVRVKDLTTLSNYQNGSSVSLDAFNRGAGNWESDAIRPAVAVSHPMASSGGMTSGLPAGVNKDVTAGGIVAAPGSRPVSAATTT